MDPVRVLGWLAGGVLLFAILLFVLGAWIAGVILLGLSLALLTLFVSSAKRKPESRAGRRLRAVAGPAQAASGRVRSFSRLVVVSGRVGLQAGPRLARIRLRRRRLKRRLQAHFRPLGEAVYGDEEDRVGQLRERASTLEEQCREADREARGILAGVREQIGRERATGAPTQAIAERHTSGL
jgi:hypothetical protein